METASYHENIMPSSQVPASSNRQMKGSSEGPIGSEPYPESIKEVPRLQSGQQSALNSSNSLPHNANMAPRDEELIPDRNGDQATAAELEMLPNVAVQAVAQPSAVKIELPSDDPEDSSGGMDGDGTISNGNGSPMDDESSKLEDSSELSFTKKLVKKSRTQSFQSVLSTASLKSLKHLSTNLGPGSTSQTTSRNNSMIGDTTSKNFQSFIQAPVLSSITKFRRSDDDIPIGKQLPFNDKLKDDGTNEDGQDNLSKSNKSLDNQQQQVQQTLNAQSEDDELLLQQQKLTLNALRNLRLSPLPISVSQKAEEGSNELKNPGVSRTMSRSKVVLEPYQPAEVDLSTFASLTRQPKLTSRNSFTSSLPKLSEKLPQSQDLRKATVLSSNNNESLPNTQGATNNQTHAQGNLTQQQQQNPHQNNQGFTQQGIPQAIHQKLNNELRQGQFLSQHQQGSISKDLTMKRQPSITFNKAYHQQQQQHHYQQQQQLQGQSPVQPQASINSPQTHTPGYQTPQQPQQQHQNGGHESPDQPLLQHRQIQQIKGLRSPMYIPAVLRKNETSPFTSTSTSPKENENGFFIQDLDRATGQVLSSTNSIRSFDSGANGEYGISKKPSFINAALETITKLAPSRKHWIKDEQALKCGIQSCPKLFNFFERRHHCRKCGGIFCNEHTSHYLYINNQAQFTTGGRGTLSKVCDNCIADYNVFIKNQFGMNETSNPNSPPPSQIPNPTTTTTATAATSVATASSGEQYDKVNDLPRFRRKDSIYDNRNEQLVGSVPANWSWSSF